MLLLMVLNSKKKTKKIHYLLNKAMSSPDRKKEHKALSSQIDQLPQKGA